MKKYKTPTIFYVVILAIGICCAGGASSVTEFINVQTSSTTSASGCFT